MFEEKESQCICCSPVCAVVGNSRSKSCTSRLPASVGEDKVPPRMPLNVALPSIVRGRLAGPWRAAVRGRQSSRFEVENETRREEEEESVPDSGMRVAGVDTLNL